MSGKPAVLVVGPMPKQQRLLEAEFSAELDLRFLEGSDSAIEIRRSAARCDHIVLWTRFASHRADQSITAREHAKERLIRVGGGIRLIREALRDLVSGRQPIA